MKEKMSNISWNYVNKSVVVVGSSRGIGKGVADSFEAAGATVYRVSSANCDISSKKQIEEYVSSLNQVDILINVAAINYTKKIEDISFEEWTEVMSVNLRGLFYFTKKVLSLMSNGSKIVNVSSIAGRRTSLVSGVHYVSSKAGLIGLTRQLSSELGGRNININVVCPSQTLTDMLAESMTEAEIQDLAVNIPLRRVATIQEQVDPILFLCSDEASYLTGAVIDVNGGQI
jgi:3-oxoacyl-[acyl-carrier protein] reductase